MRKRTMPLRVIPEGRKAGKGSIGNVEGGSGFPSPAMAPPSPAENDSAVLLIPGGLHGPRPVASPAPLPLSYGRGAERFPVIPGERSEGRGSIPTLNADGFPVP